MFITDYNYQQIPRVMIHETNMQPEERGKQTEEQIRH